MSYEQSLMLPNYGDSEESPAVFTLTLDDLSTRFAEYNGAAASIKFKLTTTDGGGNKTTADFVYLDASQGTGNAAGSLDAIGDVATLIQTQLNALAGYSGVTVNGVATVPGDQWDFTITFPGALGVTDLTFHASSQWYPTITLVEVVLSEGTPFVPGVNEQVEIGASGADDVTSDSNSNFVSLDGDGNHSFSSAGAGWTHTGGTNPSSFTADDVGAKGSVLASGNGFVTVTQAGSDEDPGTAETVSISAEPVNPTGGTWDMQGTVFNYNSTSLGFTGSGWDSVILTGGTSLADGPLQFENGVVGDVGSIGPTNIDLTAPEVTHSITAA